MFYKDRYLVGPSEAIARDRELRHMGRSLLWDFVMTVVVCDSGVRC